MRKARELSIQDIFDYFQEFVVEAYLIAKMFNLIPAIL